MYRAAVDGAIDQNNATQAAAAYFSDIRTSRDKCKAEQDIYAVRFPAVALSASSLSASSSAVFFVHCAFAFAAALFALPHVLCRINLLVPCITYSSNHVHSAA